MNALIKLASLFIDEQKIRRFAIKQILKLLKKARSMTKDYVSGTKTHIDDDLYKLFDKPIEVFEGLSQ